MQQEATLIEWHDQRSMTYPASVATTWQTSFDLLSQDGQGLLNILCWLAPDPIPLTMIQKFTAVGDEPPINVEIDIADLAEYALLKWTSIQHDFVEVHRLLQEITRYRVPESESTPNRNPRSGCSGPCEWWTTLYPLNQPATTCDRGPTMI